LRGDQTAARPLPIQDNTNTEWKLQFLVFWHGWLYNVRLAFKEIRCDVVDWIYLAQDRIQ
jgi:hypothetical protein